MRGKQCNKLSFWRYSWFIHMARWIFHFSYLVVLNFLNNILVYRIHTNQRKIKSSDVNLLIDKIGVIYFLTQLKVSIRCTFVSLTTTTTTTCLILRHRQLLQPELQKKKKKKKKKRTLILSSTELWRETSINYFHL